MKAAAVKPKNPNSNVVELRDECALDTLGAISPEFVPLYLPELLPESGEVWSWESDNPTVRAYKKCGTNNTAWRIPEHIVIIDIDNNHPGKKQGLSIWNELGITLKIPDQGKETFAIRTKRGGAHLYYKYSGDTSTLESNPDTADVIEIKKYKGLIRAPGCKGYQALNNLDIAELPKVLETYFKQKNKPKLTGKSNTKLGNIARNIIEQEFESEGAYWKKDRFFTRNPTREDNHVTTAFSIRETGQWFDHATGTGGYIARLHSEWKGISYQESKKIFNPTIDTLHENTTNSENESFNTSDMGNAYRFERDHLKSTRWIETDKAFYHYNGKRWVRDTTRLTIHKGQKTARAIYSEAEAAGLETDRKRIASWAMKCEDIKKINSMLETAKALPTISKEFDIFDSPETMYLFNCQNYTLDLKSGSLREHSPVDYITRICPHDYNAFTPEPKVFLAFLKEILEGDHALIEHLQQLAGLAYLNSIVSTSAMSIPCAEPSNNVRCRISDSLNACSTSLRSIASARVRLIPSIRLRSSLRNGPSSSVGRSSR